jgi:hypothetical protein
MCCQLESEQDLVAGPSSQIPIFVISKQGAGVENHHKIVSLVGYEKDQ